MNKWKYIRNVTMAILIAFIVYIVFIAVSIFCSNHIYPYEALGAIIINNWIEEVCLELEFRLIILGIPLLTDIIILLITCKKIRSDKNVYVSKKKREKCK